MDGEITIGTKLDTKQFDAQITELERKVNDIEKMLENPKKLGLSSRDVQELEVELEKAKNKLISLRQQKERATESGSVKQLSEGFKNFGSSIQSSIRNVARLALGIFGIRSAFMFLRRASSKVGLELIYLVEVVRKTSKR